MKEVNPPLVATLIIFLKTFSNRQKQGNPLQKFSDARQRERDDSRDRLRHNYTRHGRD